MRFIVNSINNAGVDVVAVNLLHVNDNYDPSDPSSSQAVMSPTGGYLPSSSLTITLPATEARDYFPGMMYTLTLTPEA